MGSHLPPKSRGSSPVWFVLASLLLGARGSIAKADKSDFNEDQPAPDGGVRDAIVGTFSRYGVDALRPFVASLEASGFRGDKFMLAYEAPDESLRFLEAAGWQIWRASNITGRRYNQRGNHLNVERFHAMWYFLSALPRQRYRYLLSFDVKDVIFQSDPIAGLHARLQRGEHILAASESFIYRRGTAWKWWQRDMAGAFGDAVSHWLADERRLYVNAGSLAGRFGTMVDLFLAMHGMSAAYGSATPDQAAYNVLLALEPYKSVTRVAPSEDGWAAQLGPMFSQVKQDRAKLLEPSPVIGADGILRTAGGQPFVVVHQYNRWNNVDWITAFTRAIQERYASYSPPGF